MAVVLDLFSRLVVGWAMGAHRDAELVEQALYMALEHRHPAAGLLHHSDRGSQYTSGSYQTLLAQVGIVVSMSGKGDCSDNAAMESFFSSLKGEWTDWYTYQTRQEAQLSIFEYIEVFYNRQRRHSALGYLSPVIYEQQFNGRVSKLSDSTEVGPPQSQAQSPLAPLAVKDIDLILQH